jgi:hypothetical protein
MSLLAQGGLSQISTPLLTQGGLSHIFTSLLAQGPPCANKDVNI